MTNKQKFNRIDQSKLEQKQVDVLKQIQQSTKNFTTKDEELNNKISSALDKIISALQEKNPEALKSSRTTKAKTTSKAKTTTKAKTTPTKSKEGVMKLAKEIRKPNESWIDARKRASEMMKNQKTKVSAKVDTEIKKLLAVVKKRKELQGFGKSDILRDAVRKAKPKGKRVVTKEGTTSNQYGTFENKLGRKYYENRDNHSDRLAPKYPKNFPLLATGGSLEFEDNIKKKLSKNFSLPLEIVIYVPSTKNADQKISNKEFEERIKEVEKYTSNLFGGFNGTDVDGGYMSETKGLIKEDVYKVISFSQRQNFDKKMRQLMIQIKKWAKEWGQESIGLEFEGDLFYIEKDGNYAKGGGVRIVSGREYPLGRNWTNDHRHTNKSDKHEVKYNRKKTYMSGGSTNEKEFSFKEAVNFVKDSKKDKMFFYYNVYGGNTYFTLEPTFATPTGKLKGFPSKVTITKDGKISGKNLTYELGGVMMQNQQVIDNASQSYVNYYLGEGASAGIYAKGGGVRIVSGREYPLGRNWTNDHRHTNKSDKHEVKYNRKKTYMSGGKMDSPKIYVADLEAYNSGKLVGKWLDLTDYNDADELMDEISKFLQNSGGEEYAIHDYENFPSSLYSEYMGEKDFEQLYDLMDLADRNDLPLEVVVEIVSMFNENAVDDFYGVYDSAEDFAEQISSDMGIDSIGNIEYYAYISETDRRLLAQDMADSYVSDIEDEDGGERIISEANMDVAKFKRADEDEQQEMIEKAKEIVYDEYYDTWYDGLNDPYYFLVEEQGLYDADSFANANFVQIDYEKLGDDLEQDYTYIYHNGDLYVFGIR